MINLFFFLHDYSGARTYAEELLSYLAKVNEIKIHKVFYESRHYKEYTIIQDNTLLEIHIPPVNFEGIKLDKYSDRCLDLMHPLLVNKENLVVHLNNLTQAKVCSKVKQRYNAKVIYTLHFLPDFLSYMFNENIYDIRNTGDALEREIIQKADRVICVTRFARECAINFYKRTEQDVVAIHNGYGNTERPNNLSDFERAQLKIELGFKPEERIILFVGLLEERKGIKYLVKAFNDLCKTNTNLRLVIAGSGEYDDALQNAIGCWGSITFTGKIAPKYVKQLYQLATIGVIPSIYEQCSYVALEMMKNGLPVVVASAPGLKELYKDNIDALLVPLNGNANGEFKLEVNTQDLQRALTKLLNDNSLQNTFKNASYQKWLQNYTVISMGEKTIKQYYELI